MLTLCGCGITPDDARRLVATLVADGSPTSLEAAAAISWGAAGELDASALEPDLRNAILAALEDNPTGSSSFAAAAPAIIATTGKPAGGVS